MLPLLILPLLMLPTANPAHAAPDLSKIKLPPGYQISFFVTDIEGARSLTKGEHGTIFVGTRTGGKVYAVVDKHQKGKPGRPSVYTVASGLNMPNGVAFRNGSLYVAEISRILRFDRIESRLANPPSPVVVYDKLPRDEHHGWKFIAFGPDGYLYVPVGAPCNICEPQNPIYATILRMRVDGSKGNAPEIFAKGVRNTVGFDWHPVTKELWFTDNGRDWLGDDAPPDELNRAPKKGLHFGYPYCHGGTIPDPIYGKKHSCSEFVKPAQNLGPHVASLGMRFWNGKIIIAEHGSWNRSTPIGYRLTIVDLKGNEPQSYKVFAEGWLQGSEVLGRPVDVLPLGPDTLLVSDDHANVIYKISKPQVSH